MLQGRCNLDGNRIVSLNGLKEFVTNISRHAALCQSLFEFFGETNQHGLACTLVSMCTKCGNIVMMETSSKIKIGPSTVHAVNAGAILGQVATGGGGAHLEEQMSSMDIPTMQPNTFS